MMTVEHVEAGDRYGITVALCTESYITWLWATDHFLCCYESHC